MNKIKEKTDLVKALWKFSAINMVIVIILFLVLWEVILEQ